MYAFKKIESVVLIIESSLFGVFVFLVPNSVNEVERPESLWSYRNQLGSQVVKAFDAPSLVGPGSIPGLVKPTLDI